MWPFPLWDVSSLGHLRLVLFAVCHNLQWWGLEARFFQMPCLVTLQVSKFFPQARGIGFLLDCFSFFPKCTLELFLHKIDSSFHRHTCQHLRVLRCASYRGRLILWYMVGQFVETLHRSYKPLFKLVQARTEWLFEISETFWPLLLLL